MRLKWNLYFGMLPHVAFGSDLRIADELESDISASGSARDLNRIALFRTVFLVKFVVYYDEICFI